MKNWKTTLGGIVAAVGTYLSGQDGHLQAVGQVLTIVGTLILGHSASDAGQRR